MTKDIKIQKGQVWFKPLYSYSMDCDIKEFSRYEILTIIKETQYVYHVQIDNNFSIYRKNRKYLENKLISEKYSLDLLETFKNLENDAKIQDSKNS